MADGRKKPHHTHEINDAYAEGWDARMLWRPGVVAIKNPYVMEVVVVPAHKQSAARNSAQRLDAQQWQEGWDDCNTDLERGDLDEVKPEDFRRVVITHIDPDCED
jgi:hypothetical protein